VLGANDGLLSTASLIIGVASGSASHATVLLTGAAGLMAGAMSMAAGEYVSVSSQADTEKADLRREAQELRTNPDAETRELSGIYQKRGLDPELAQDVARQLMATDALKAHAQDELGLSDVTAANPLQAALASAASFAVGAAPPVVVALFVPQGLAVIAIAVVTMVALAALGAAGAKIGGAPIAAAVVRVSFWGALAMIVTAGLGHVLGAAI
jgi:VIT1/CCC1 family predicted Fe2+/Mn2+ transporter